MENDIIKFLEKEKPLIDSIIKKYIPENLDKKALEQIFGKARYTYDIEALNKSLNEPIWDFLKRGGKRWRPALFFLITEALGGDLEKVKDFAMVIELAHNGSIMIDDIEDSGEMRRGKPCAHKMFGIDTALNAGNMMYFLPLLVFMKNKNRFDKKTMLRAYDVFSQEMINIHAGQAMDIYWHKGKVDNIRESQYLQMCAYKTGTLARMSARLATVLSGGTKEQEEKMGKMAETIGIAFQIQDDILSASSKKFQRCKGYGDDIKEGKRTLMVINALEKADKKDRKRLLEIINMHTNKKELVKEAIDILNKYDSINYAKEFARKLVTESWKDVDPILKDSEAKSKLKRFVDFLVERDI